MAWNETTQGQYRRPMDRYETDLRALGMLEKAPQVTKLWGGRRLRGTEVGGRAEGLRPRIDHRDRPERDRPETEGYKGLHGPLPSLGGGGDICVDVAVPTPGEGIRAETGELPGVGAARGLPVPDAPGGTGANAMNSNRNIKSMSYGSSSEEKSAWASPKGSLGMFIVREAEKSLKAYREQPRLVAEHARIEQDTAQGGYANRQLFELVQNSADALLDAPEGKSILLRLTDGFLYCADDGLPLDEEGVEGLMFDRMSSKRTTAAIGRFGRGFKSVLGVTDAPEFYSRTGSFRFDKSRAAERIAQVASADHYPVLRLPEPIDPGEERERDDELRELMSWATNVVRLPLKLGVNDDLAKQISEFPSEFLLFVDHVRYLILEDGEGSRDITPAPSSWQDAA